jgi:hypothetical protein
LDAFVGVSHGTSFRAAVTKGLGGGSGRAAPDLDRDRGKGGVRSQPRVGWRRRLPW